MLQSCALRHIDKVWVIWNTFKHWILHRNKHMRHGIKTFTPAGLTGDTIPSAQILSAASNSHAIVSVRNYMDSPDLLGRYSMETEA